MCDDDFFGDDFEDSLLDPDDDFQEDLTEDVDDSFAANFDAEAAAAREETEIEAAENQLETMLSEIEDEANDSPVSQDEKSTFDKTAAIMFGSMVVGQAIEENEDRKVSREHTSQGNREKK